LLGLWKKIKRKASSGRAPQLVQRETSLTRGIVRDLLSDKVDLLLVDSKLLYNEIEQYLKQIDPELLPRVKMYHDETPLFDAYDIETKSNRDKVLQELRAHLGRDRARTRAFAVSELGLIEMTRQRVRPSLWQSMTTECPTCNATGRVFRPEVVVRRMERSLKRAG